MALSLCHHFNESFLEEPGLPGSAWFLVIASRGKNHSKYVEYFMTLQIYKVLSVEKQQNF